MKPTGAELTYVDQVGRFFSTRYDMPPVTGRVLGWLMICEPAERTAAEIAEDLQMSRSAVGAAVATLERWGQARRIRRAGERADRISVIAAAGEHKLAEDDEYSASAALGREGLELLRDEPLERKGRLLEMVAFAEFLIERMPAVAEEWHERRAALRASGELP